MFFKGNFATGSQSYIIQFFFFFFYKRNARADPGLAATVCYITLVILFTSLCLLEDVMKQRVASFPPDLTNVVIIYCPTDEVAPHCGDI